MNFSEIIREVEWSFENSSSTCYVDDRTYTYHVDNVDDDLLAFMIRPDIKLFDYAVDIDGCDVEIEEIEAELHFIVLLKFDSVDKEKCSFTTRSIDFHGASIFSMSDHEDLMSEVNDMIDSDIQEGRIVLSEPQFKVILNTLQ